MALLKEGVYITCNNFRMKKLLLIFSTLIIFTNVSYASFPVDNELIKISNQIDITERMEETFSNPNEILLFILGIGFLAGMAFLIYWGVKKIISQFREGDRRKINLIIGLLLVVLVFIWLQIIEVGYTANH